MYAFENVLSTREKYKAISNLAGRIFYRRKILSGVGVHIGGGGDG